MEGKGACLSASVTSIYVKNPRTSQPTEGPYDAPYSTSDISKTGLVGSSWCFDILISKAGTVELYLATKVSHGAVVSDLRESLPTQSISSSAFSQARSIRGSFGSVIKAFPARLR